MTDNPKSVFVFLLIFNIVLAIAGHTVAAGREILAKLKNIDKTQFESVIGKDDSFLVPRIGCFMFLRVGHGLDPFTYNPVTGTNGGVGVVGGADGDNTGSDSRAPRNYVPGGDDTFIPNPDFEVPNLGSSGGITPTVAHP